MRLRRVSVRDFRALQGCFAVEGIGDGITVIAGANEDGKSTLLAALKAAFFEHHAVGGQVRREMSPFAGGVPAVEVTFERGGTTWHLSKAFRKSGAELRSGGKRWAGDEAEARLVEMLGFERRTAHKPRPENHGLQALFWVDQGTTFAGWEPLAGGRERLGAAIAAEVGAAAGGETMGRLLTKARAEADRYWTATWRETGQLTGAVEARSAVEAEADALEVRAREQAAKVDRLARLHDERRCLITDDALGRAEAARAEARGLVNAVDEQQRELTTLAERAKACDAEASNQQAKKRERLQWIAELRRLTLAEAEEEGICAALASEMEHAETALAGAEAEEKRLAAVLERARAEARRLEISATRARLAADLARHEARCAEAIEASRRGRELRAMADANLATIERIEAIRAAAITLQTASAALQAAATMVELEPAPGMTATRNGAAVDPSRPLHLTERTVLDLDGFGCVVIVPGGADTGRHRSNAREADAALAQALAAVGAPDIAAAEERAAARVRLLASAAEAEAQLATILRACEVRTLDAMMLQAANARAALAALPGPAEPEPATADRAPEAVAAELMDLEARLDAARADVRTRERQAGEARRAAALADQAARATALGRSVIDARLAEGRAALADEQLDDLVSSSAQAALAAASERSRIEGQLALAQPDLLRARLAQEERRVEQLRSDQHKLDRDVLSLESELRALGDDGLGERLSEAKSRLERAVAKESRVRCEAQAWKLLVEELRAVETAGREALARPLLDRIDPWLQRLFPGARAELDAASLAPERLVRGELAEPVAMLSHGTREQLAVLVRLGLAQLLGEREGEAPCLVLDDALVYADETRFATMKAILGLAAADLQIIVLTCRQRDYAGLTDRVLRLEDCRVPSRALVHPTGAD